MLWTTLNIGVISSNIAPGKDVCSCLSMRLGVCVCVEVSRWTYPPSMISYQTFNRSITITILDIIHRSVFYLKLNISKTGLFPSSGGTYVVAPNRKSYSLPPDISSNNDRIYKTNTTQTNNTNSRY
jgi:hypothetical protein